MNRRDLIFVGVGFALGYIVCKAVSNKTNVVKDMSLADTSNQTLPPASTNEPAEAGTTQIEEPEVVETLDTPKISYCKEKWIKYSENKKFGSEDQLQNTYDNYMANCVGKM